MTLMSQRSSGVLLHLTALPGGEGIGDLGEAAHRFVDWLALAGQSWWQVLPCTPTGYGDSPYQSPSAYAGNPLLVSLQRLIDWQLITQKEIDASLANHQTKHTNPINNRVDFNFVRDAKLPLLELACERFHQQASAELANDFQRFCTASEQFWLHDYARFCVLKARFAGAPWQDWPSQLSGRDLVALADLDERNKTSIEQIKLQQFVFASQWSDLKTYAAENGIGLIGDCPIYVATDSADVWSQPEFFDLSEDGKPRVVAGVPPDYFSATGQLWGNPLYRWEQMHADGYRWWQSRIKHCATLFDVTRIDHFRAFDAYWAVPGDAPDASTGSWQQGPGHALLEVLLAEDVQLLAEDLGDLTESVHALRNTFKLPGMRVLQFGFDGGDNNPHAIEHIGSDVVCYLGTHDNNTTLGWYDEQGAQLQTDLQATLGATSRYDVLQNLLDLALMTSAPLCVLTMQDVLGLDGSARFNTPGTIGGNWCWRMAEQAANAAQAEALLHRTQNSGRIVVQQDPNLLSTAAELAH